MQSIFDSVAGSEDYSTTVNLRLSEINKVITLCFVETSSLIGNGVVSNKGYL